MRGPLPARQVRTAFVLLCMVGAFACAFAVVAPTNFAGYDEWLYLWLARNGVLTAPYANRPLNFLWTIPGAWLTSGFLGFHVLHMVYLAATGLLTWTLSRRVAPGQDGLATVAGLAAAIFAPGDMARLSTVQMTLVSGSTVGTMLALVALVEAGHRRRPLLLALAAALAFIAARSYEATLGVLVMGLLLLVRPVAQRNPPVWLLIVWGAVLAGTAALALIPHISHDGRALYQASVWGFDPRPAAVLPRLWRQYSWHLGPLVRPGPAALGSAATLGAAALAILAVALSSRTPLEKAPGWRAGLRSVRPLALVGVALSLAAYVPFALSGLMDAPHRAQMAAAPWIGMILASVIGALSSCTPTRARTPLVAACAGWIVLVGAGRTRMLQDAWNAQSHYGTQMRSLAGLARIAPQLEPHTLVLAIQDADVWPSVFGFRHAVQGLYREAATGYVVGGLELMYPTRKIPSGVVTETWPELRGPWGVAPTHHRYDELLVVRIAPDGTLSLVSTWPESALGPLPAGAVYGPQMRIRGSP